MTAKKYIYSFEEGDATMVSTLGGKGANIAEMTNMGLPVPLGFTLATEVCRVYSEKGRLPKGLRKEIKEEVKELEEKIGKEFGSSEDPLLVSVRSGAPVSMPGMMDTILNVGLNDKVVKSFAKMTSEDFAYDSYRRLIQMFGDTVKGIEPRKFDDELIEMRKKHGVDSDAEVSVEGKKELVRKFKEIYKEETGEEFPQDPMEQLLGAITAVFGSWNNEEAIKYREHHDMPHDIGTACNVQMMVFGNMGQDSGTGVAFTRNPSTGEDELYGEYLLNAQGEDVVRGIRTPKDIHKLKADLPEVFEEIKEMADRLEEHYKKVQDFEFTIQNGKLWILQTRTGKRTAKATIRFAVDFVKEGIIRKDEAVMRIKPKHIRRILHKQIDPDVEEEEEAMTEGINASPGAATGKVVFNSDEAEELAERGDEVILVRPETAPEDFGGMVASRGILTSRGGTTSHAAIVARSIGTPAVVGAEEIDTNLEGKKFKVKNQVIRKGGWITIDGGNGKVYKGKLKTIRPGLFPEAEELLKWADEHRELGIWANASRPDDIKRAMEFGAEGVGLSRTEYLFMGERTEIVQDLVLAEDKEERKEVLERLIPLQKGDFKEMMKASEGKKILIRLLDAPFHEFFPNYEDLVREVAKLEDRKPASKELEKKRRLLEALKRIRDINPMMGFRVCRLGIVYPEVYKAQARAALEAAAELKDEEKRTQLGIMIPGIADYKELEILRKDIEDVAEQVEAEYDVDLSYEIGTMIETPRAALTSGKIARVADFFSFGTNDLTQMTFGMSRDDAERSFMAQYLEKGVFEHNPFQVLDKQGVAELMEKSVRSAKEKKELDIGICGEHGGEPDSIRTAEETGLDYVSCSPFRIPIARLVTAKIAIKKKWEEEGYEPKDIGY